MNSTVSLLSQTLRWREERQMVKDQMHINV